MERGNAANGFSMKETEHLFIRISSHQWAENEFFKSQKSVFDKDAPGMTFEQLWTMSGFL